MDFFSHDGFELAYLDRQPASGQGDPVLMIHGFASSHYVNWVSPGWFKTLNDAGYRAIAFDHRGHGSSSKSYDEADYTPAKMASDAAALLDHLGIERAHVMGYSMGARVSAFLALSDPQKVATLVFGGLGIGMVDGVGDWDPIAAALLAEDPRKTRIRAAAPSAPSQTRRAATGARSRRASQRRAELLSEDDMARIAQPTLIAVGTKDDIGGSPDELAALMPNARAFHIEGRDHMLAVGDKSFKQRVLEFYAEYPL
ncbi:alpha/beta fold hydrolase [Mesorhizobium atlanticum]